MRPLGLFRSIEVKRKNMERLKLSSATLAIARIDSFGVEENEITFFFALFPREPGAIELS